MINSNLQQQKKTLLPSFILFTEKKIKRKDPELDRDPLSQKRIRGSETLVNTKGRFTEKVRMIFNFSTNYRWVTSMRLNGKKWTTSLPPKVMAASAKRACTEASTRTAQSARNMKEKTGECDCITTLLLVQGRQGSRACEWRWAVLVQTLPQASLCEN